MSSYMLLQAKKRKLGLLEDDDAAIIDLAEQISAKEKEFGVKKPVITNTPGMNFYSFTIFFSNAYIWILFF